MTSEEIMKAMKEFTPIECDGIVYKRIAAYTYRCTQDRHTGKYRFVREVELEDKGGNSVTVTSPDKIKTA